MGEIIEDDISVDGMKIGFGNCCSADIGLDKIIKGCPPYPFKLRDFLHARGVVLTRREPVEMLVVERAAN